MLLKKLFQIIQNIKQLVKNIKINSKYYYKTYGITVSVFGNFFKILVIMFI